MTSFSIQVLVQLLPIYISPYWVGFPLKQSVDVGWSLGYDIVYSTGECSSMHAMACPIDQVEWFEFHCLPGCVCVCVCVASFPGPRPASRRLQYSTEFYLGNVRACPGLEPPVVYRTASDGKLGEGLGTRLCVCVCVCVSPPLSIVHCSSYSVNTNPNIWHSSVYFSTWCGGTNEQSPQIWYRAWS